MTLHLNPTCAVRLDPVYEYGPEQINPETGFARPCCAGLTFTARAEPGSTTPRHLVA